MQQGFVLATALLLVMLLALIALSLFERSLLEGRMSEGLLDHYQREAAIMAGIDAGIKAIVAQKSDLRCWYAHPFFPAVTEQSPGWWESSATCQGKLAEIPYRFVIELVNDDKDCLQYLQVTSYLPSVGGQWERSTLLRVDTQEILQHTCALRLDEEDFVSHLKKSLFLLSTHAIYS
ncbi:MAG: hypothetical protein K0R12_206 [Gammaproteobacteria bacterium]|jgi:hypothetical protein|nr:hypothetical protein [Gammaproteobacteria bacterium]